MRPVLLRSLFGICLSIAACSGVTPSSSVGAQPAALEIRSESLVLKLDEPGLNRVGKLIWRGGISMTANSANFGGWSDLDISPDGRVLSSVSDLGSWLTATIDYDSQGNLAGLSNGRIGSLRDLEGRPLARKEEADAEAMARLPDGSWLVAFERHHRIWHYPALDGTPRPINLPGDFARQPSNGGVEAITVQANGTIIAISEEYSPSPGVLAGWIGSPAGPDRYDWQSFQYARIPDFHPTALAPLPDGGYVLLERAFDMVRGVRVRVMRLDAGEIAPGATVKPRELARLVPPVAVDNLEGVAATRGARGETLIWLISDDNFSPMQRNLLLLFELEK